MIDTKNLTIKKTHKHLTHGDFSVAELCDTYLDTIKKKDKDIHAFLEVFNDVPAQVRRAQKMIDDDIATELTGVPIAVKDNILIESRRVGAASKMLEAYIEP